ncbi:hypothetical protein [Desulforhopalus sp. IMCC35007]|uniref:hypothetical protein n=1 Tax=Desulforhopalus sp. IMCC35007 TaxID=2569543 RepID=UPI0010AE35F6|nr:hypothetical protein [Desulforhopalus sp. IMCC35007]TKB09379.1 hypothetical protein FCL48_10510 [Desulforhopalus sp. IMCC35007]
MYLKTVANKMPYLFRLSLLIVISMVATEAKTACLVDKDGTYIEAEHFTGSSQLASSPTSVNQFTLLDDASYSNGQALVSGTGGYAANTPGNEVKEYELTFPEVGTYQIWMRGRSGGDGNSDSMFFTLDNQTWKAWNYGGNNSSITWTSSMQVGGDNTIEVTVITPGTHTLKIAMREDNSIIDGFYITKGSEVPDNTFMDPTVKTVLNPQLGCVGAYWSTDNNLVGVTNYYGYNAPSTTVTITNIGEDDTQAATISVDQSWVNIDDTSMAALLAGDSHTITLSFATAALAVGTHSAEITITGGANNSGLTIPITLLVKDAPATAACGEVPLYAQNLVTPAIMVQLDSSGSMNTSMTLATTVGQNTSSLTTIVQNIVNRTNWQPNNAMGFVISGTGIRRAWSYDGNVNNAPVLSITYSSGTGNTVTVEQNIFGSGNDIQGSTGNINTTATYLELGRSGEPVGLRFTDVNVPQGATITSAYITFTAYQPDAATSNLTIRGVAEDNVTDITTTPNLTSSVTWSPSTWRASMQRIDIAEDVLSEVFQDQTISWGFATWEGGNCNSSGSDDAPDYYTDYVVGCHEHDQTHYDALQQHVYDGYTAGCTPLVPTMRAGLEYFKGNRSDNNYGEPYTILSCQPRILVIVTDGQGNTATDNTRIDTVVDDLIAEGVSIVTVGFGLTNAAQLDRIVQKMQTAGEADDEDDLFHLHNEDANGVAIPFMAQNRQEFIDAMNDIVKAVKAQVFYGSSPAATTSASDDTIGVLLNASFDASDWSGSLTAKEFDAFTGELNPIAKWTTTTTLAGATINGFIADSIGTVTAYNEASITGDNFLCKPMGDIINSVPKLIADPPYFYKFDNYSSFKYNGNVRARDDLAYVASNDGALHAFLISDGTEKWRFYPSAVTAELGLATTSAVDDMCSSAYCHKFLLDGSPQAADVNVYEDAISTVKEWKTILVTGQGKGGGSFFGLDVTYGNDFVAATNPSKLLWEYSSGDLGLATSTPVTQRVSVFEESSIAPTVATSESSWVTFFGSGSASTTLLQSEKQAYIFAINSWDASPVWEDLAENDVASVKLSATELKNDKPASPIVVDIFNDDYLYDALYAGNLYGNMYRVSNIGVNQVPVVQEIYDSGLTDHTSPVTAKAEVAYADNNDYWVYFGTGRYEDQVDKFTVDQQYFFALQENFDTPDNTDSSKDELHEVAEKNTPFTMSDLVVLTTGIVEGYAIDSDGNRVDQDGNGNIDADDLLKYRTLSCPFPDTDGNCNPDAESWVLKLAIPTDSGSERVISRPLIVAGIAFFATFVPDSDVCAGDGDTWLFAIDMKTGGIVSNAVFDLNDDGTFDSSTDRQIKTGLTDETTTLIGGIYIGEGKPTDELVLHNDILFVGTSTQPPLPIKVNLPDQRAKLKAWRQKFN